MIMMSTLLVVSLMFSMILDVSVTDCKAETLVLVKNIVLVNHCPQ